MVLHTHSTCERVPENLDLDDSTKQQRSSISLQINLLSKHFWNYISWTIFLISNYFGLHMMKTIFLYIYNFKYQCLTITSSLSKTGDRSSSASHRSIDSHLCISSKACFASCIKFKKKKNLELDLTWFRKANIQGIKN